MISSLPCPIDRPKEATSDNLLKAMPLIQILLWRGRAEFSLQPEAKIAFSTK